MRRAWPSHGGRRGRLPNDVDRFDAWLEEAIMNDAPRHEANRSTTQARQGTTPEIVRWVLEVSLLLAIVAMVIAYWIA